MPVKKKAVKKKRGRKTNPLTSRRLQFCFEYLIDQDGSKAVRRAGYKCKTPQVAAAMAHEILQVPEVKAVIKAGLDAKLEKAKVDADWVLRQSVKIYERCMQEEAVTDSYGNQTGEYKFDSAGANKAIDTVGKHVDIQAFKEKVEVNASKDIIDFFAGITQSKGPPSERGK